MPATSVVLVLQPEIRNGAPLFETIETELMLADVATLERRKDKIRRSAKGDPDAAALLQTVDRVLEALER